MKIYTVKIEMEAETKYECVSACDELEAIDKVHELYKNKEILDIKVV